MKSKKLHNPGFGRQLPPAKDAVIIWFIQKGSSEAVALEYYAFYNSRQWLNNKYMPLKDWKMTAWQWLWNSGNIKLFSL